MRAFSMVGVGIVIILLIAGFIILYFPAMTPATGTIADSGTPAGVGSPAAGPMETESAPPTEPVNPIMQPMESAITVAPIDTVIVSSGTPTVMQPVGNTPPWTQGPVDNTPPWTQGPVDNTPPWTQGPVNNNVPPWPQETVNNTPPWNQGVVNNTPPWL